MFHDPNDLIVIGLIFSLAFRGFMTGKPKELKIISNIYEVFILVYFCDTRKFRIV